MATATKRKRSSKSTNEDWDKVRAAVKADLAALETMPTHRELYSWAVENKLNTKTLFPMLKREWRKYDIEYEELRAATLNAEFEEMTAAADGAPELTLWIYTDAGHGVFAVCSADGAAAWYGEFHEDDRIFQWDENQDKADLSAADKAIFLAGEARKEREVPVVRLTLRTSNHTIAADTLAKQCLSNKVVLTVEVVDGANPATEWVMESGYASWRDIRLDRLFTAEVDSSEDDPEEE